MKISDLARDTAVINDGRWVKDIPGLEDVEFKVRGQTSKAFTSALAHNVASLTRDQRDEQGKPFLDHQWLCIAEAIHSAILLDWKNLEDEHGKQIKYDKALAHKWLTDPNLNTFRNGVMYAAALVDDTRPPTKKV